MYKSNGDIHLARGQKENGEWEQGYYVCVGGRFHYILTGQIDLTSGYPRFFYSKVKPETIGRCSGLRDKDGTLLFEGDIVRVEEYVFTVALDEYCRFMMIGSEGNYLLAREFSEDVELVGNKFDNPELLDE